MDVFFRISAYLNSRVLEVDFESEEAHCAERMICRDNQKKADTQRIHS